MRLRHRYLNALRWVGLLGGSILAGLVVVVAVGSSTGGVRETVSTLHWQLKMASPAFVSCSEAAKNIAIELDDESRELLRTTPFDDLIKFHMGWGTGIRNSMGLWHGNEALNASCAELRGQRGVLLHPDSVSMILIEEVWKEVQNTSPRSGDLPLK